MEPNEHQDRRDYNEAEKRLIRQGCPARAKEAWHQRHRDDQTPKK